MVITGYLNYNYFSMSFKKIAIFLDHKQRYRMVQRKISFHFTFYFFLRIMARWGNLMKFRFKKKYLKKYFFGPCGKSSHIILNANMIRQRDIHTAGVVLQPGRENQQVVHNNNSDN